MSSRQSASDGSGMGGTGSAMGVVAVRRAQVAHPTGDPDFAVLQAFPAAFPAAEADPFLMCDLFGPEPSTGPARSPDAFPISWHPHRGMDIATYLVEGRGRHGDSLGNRGTYAAPGLQWVSVGSGIEHAEAFDTPAGENTTGFQIWVNVPSARKMDDPRYGTVNPSDLPVLSLPGGVMARVLAGEAGGARGPFTTAQPLQMIDFTLPANAAVEHAVPLELNNALAFVFRGAATTHGGRALHLHDVVRYDATQASARTLRLEAGPEGASVLLFAGRRLEQPIAWRGPFVMTTDEEIAQTISDYRKGKFPPKRVPWDYRRLAAFPANWKSE
jgi:redox-sensitive bicupin YhaK (pirin superfamily)